MFIEWLNFKVPPVLYEQYIQSDAEIWTPALTNHPGFLGKEVWLNPDDQTEIVIVVRWASREQWKSFPQKQLEQLEFQIAEIMGCTCQLVEASEYYLYKLAKPE